MIIVLGITNLPLYTRVVRAEVLRLKEVAGDVSRSAHLRHHAAHQPG